MDAVNADFHIHSHHSPDGTASVAAMCAAAVDAGLSSVCFTDHIDIGCCPLQFCIADPDAYRAEVFAAREAFPSLEIGLGVEIGAMPASHEAELAAARAVAGEAGLDYLLLSCHDAGGTDPYFTECYAGRTRAQVAEAYFASIIAGQKLYPHYDALAHIGYLYRYLGKYALYQPHERDYLSADAPDMLEAILRDVIAKGAALELNMSEYSAGRTMPHADIIRRYVALGGEACIYGSDAHRPCDVGRHRREALELLRGCGVKYLAAYRHRERTLERI